MKKLLPALLLSVLSANVAAIQLIEGTVDSNRNETRGYAGLNWTLGGGFVPALVLGVSHARVSSGGHLEGAGLSLGIRLAGGLAPGALKLNYLNGEHDFYGQAGVGYDFAKNAPLVGVGINGSYLGLGVDAYGDRSFVPFASINSLEFEKPEATKVLLFPNIQQ